MAEFPFSVTIKPTRADDDVQSVKCVGLLRSVGGKRQVYDALWGDRPVILKVFSDRVKAKYHMNREWRGLSLLQGRGLNSPEPLFYGRTNDGRWAVVVEKIGNSETALDALHKTEEKSRRLDLLVPICRELAKLHDNGIIQQDLHLGNFLLCDGKAFVLDPGSMRFFSQPVTKKRSISQLALLLLHGLTGKEADIIAELCRVYSEARNWNFGQTDKQLFHKQLTMHKKKGVKRGLAKCLRTSKRYLRIKADRYVAVFDRGFCRDTERLDFVRQLDALMDKGQILKEGNTCYVSHLHWNGQDVVVKRYNHKGLVHSLRHSIKRSRARRGWLHAHRLIMLGIATPRPLAYIDQLRAALVWKSYLVTEYVEGQKLYDFLRDGKTGQEQRSMAFQQVKELLDKLGKYRITHGDLKHTNILITENGPVLTDLDAMRAHKWSWIHGLRQSKDLERFINKGNGGQRS
ncbi:MAG: lipopolysaccharide kinase InaA family protein [Planctomycetota bacterium]|jgi:tRNA A-37 threonylcarbamoyl transferase component Bud32